MTASNQYLHRLEEHKVRQEPLFHPVRQPHIVHPTYHTLPQWHANRLPPSNQTKAQNSFQPPQQRYEILQPQFMPKYLSPLEKNNRKESINGKSIFENKPPENYLRTNQLNKSPNKVQQVKGQETKTRIMSPITNIKVENNHDCGNKNGIPQQVCIQKPGTGGGKVSEGLKYFKKRSTQIHINDNKNYVVANNNPREVVEPPKYLPKQEAEATYYVSDLVDNIFNKRSEIYTHFYQIFKNFRNNHQQLVAPKEIQPVNLPPDIPSRNRKTIIFDLDETLIHCTKTSSPPYDIILPVKQPEKNSITEVGFNIRPYAKEILENLSKHFEIIVFTASHSYYANAILDYLDPQKKLIDHRLYRQHCQQPKKGFFVKDLRVIPRNPCNMILIDNSSLSYCFQPENGVPILSYISGKSDNELKKLQEFLMKLRDVSDVRSVISRTFKTMEYGKFQHADSAIKQLYMKNA